MNQLTHDLSYKKCFLRHIMLETPPSSLSIIIQKTFDKPTLFHRCYYNLIINKQKAKFHKYTKLTKCLICLKSDDFDMKILTASTVLRQSFIYVFNMQHCFYNLFP